MGAPSGGPKTSSPKLADIQRGDQYLKAKASIGETYTALFRHKTAIELEYKRKIFLPPVANTRHQV